MKPPSRDFLNLKVSVNPPYRSFKETKLILGCEQADSRTLIHVYNLKCCRDFTTKWAVVQLFMWLGKSEWKPQKPRGLPLVIIMFIHFPCKRGHCTGGPHFWQGKFSSQLLPQPPPSSPEFHRKEERLGQSSKSRNGQQFFTFFSDQHIHMNPSGMIVPWSSFTTEENMANIQNYVRCDESLSENRLTIK